MTDRNALRTLMTKAHFSARWKRASNHRLTYREAFTAALKAAWEQVKRVASSRLSAATREAQRDDQNLNGVPVSSFYGERNYFLRQSRCLSSVGE